MNIVYLSKKPFHSIESEGFRARKGNVVAHFLRSSRVQEFRYVWLGDELLQGQDRVIDENIRPKVKLTKVPRLPLPCVRSIRLLKKLDNAYKSRILTRIVKDNDSEVLPKIIFTHDPRFLFILNNDVVPKACVVIDLIDDFRIHPHLGEPQRKVYRSAYSMLSKKTDVVFTVGKRAASQLENNGVNSFWIPNGVDWNRYQSTIGRLSEEPEDLMPLPHPRIAYIGILSSATDHELLNRVAETTREGSVVFIGKWMGRPRLLNRKIHCLGFKPADQVLNYFANIDIGLVIYERSEYLRFIDSTKIYEYLAAGKPVITTKFQDNLSRFKFVRQAGSADEFVEAVRQTHLELKGVDTNKKATEISDSVRDCDWSQRINQMLDIMNNYTHQS